MLWRHVTTQEAEVGKAAADLMMMMMMMLGSESTGSITNILRQHSISTSPGFDYQKGSIIKPGARVRLSS